MVRNYFHDLNVTIPITAKLEGLQDPRGPASIFEEDNEDITYHEKLKFSEQLSFLSSNQLEKVIDEIIKSCPKAYRDMPEGKGQILVDNMDLIFFSEISL